MSGEFEGRRKDHRFCASIVTHCHIVECVGLFNRHLIEQWVQEAQGFATYLNRRLDTCTPVRYRYVIGRVFVFLAMLKVIVIVT